MSQEPTAEADYAASKPAVVSVTQSPALALAEFGVRVNAVCPGVVETDMTRRLHQDRAERQAISEEDSLAGMTRRIPLGRAATPGEIADSIAYLLGPSSQLRHWPGTQRVRWHGDELTGPDARPEGRARPRPCEHSSVVPTPRFPGGHSSKGTERTPRPQTAR